MSIHEREMMSELLCVPIDDDPRVLDTIPPWALCALRCNCAAPCSETQYTDAGSSSTQFPMVTEAREPRSILTDSEEDSEEDSGSELDPHGFVLPPGWVTVPRENGRTFKWTNGERTVGTVTEVWASCHGTSSSSVDAVPPNSTGGTHISFGDGVDELISVSALIDSLQLTSEEQEELGLMSIVTSKQGSSDACGCRTTSDSQEAPLLLSAQELEALFGDLQLLEAAGLISAGQPPPLARVPTATTTPDDAGATSLGAAPPEKSEGYFYGAAPGALLVFSGESLGESLGDSLGDASPHAVSSACASIEPAAPESLDSAELEGLDRAWELLSASEGIELLQVLEQDAQQLADADLRQIFDDDEEANHGGSNMNMDDVDD